MNKAFNRHAQTGCRQPQFCHGYARDGPAEPTCKYNSSVLLVALEWGEYGYVQTLVDSHMRLGHASRDRLLSGWREHLSKFPWQYFLTLTH